MRNENFPSIPDDQAYQTVIADGEWKKLQFRDSFMCRQTKRKKIIFPIAFFSIEFMVKDKAPMKEITRLSFSWSRANNWNDLWKIIAYWSENILKILFIIEIMKAKKIYRGKRAGKLAIIIKIQHENFTVILISCISSRGTSANHIFIL